MQRRLGPVHVLDETLDPAGEGEVLALAVALVDQLDLDSVVEERELADAPCQDVVVKLHQPEGRLRSHEVDLGTAPLGRSDNGKQRDRDAVAELHLVGAAVAPDPQLEPLGEPVDHRHAYAVKAAGHLYEF